MTRLDELLARHPLHQHRWGSRIIVLLIAALLGWAAFARLDEVAVAPGEVVPQGKVKIIQHLEGGIIESIAVAEGDQVTAGQALLRLNLATGGVNRAELQARLDAESLKRTRLRAEAAGGEPAFPADAAARQRDLAQAERQTFEARRRELASSRLVLQEQLRQKQLAVQELEARRKAAGNNLTLARQRLQMSESLLSEGLMARMEHLKLQAEVESLEGELGSLGPALPRARAAVAEAEQRLAEIDIRFRREAQDGLSAAEEQIARLTELQAEATDQGRRAEIRSPIDGVVKKLRSNTIGGVIAAGEPIMEIVPTSDKLVVSARLDPADRGLVSPGQPAVVKVTAYDFIRYGSLDGKVVQVAPDATQDPSGRPYFEVVVETDRAHLGETTSLPIIAGMQATIDIHTGSRTVLEYLITPVLKLRSEAFRER
jgi:adhesin transport system membrane fusion protein